MMLPTARERVYIFLFHHSLGKAIVENVTDLFTNFIDELNPPLMTDTPMVQPADFLFPADYPLLARRLCEMEARAGSGATVYRV